MKYLRGHLRSMVNLLVLNGNYVYFVVCMYELPAYVACRKPQISRMINRRFLSHYYKFTKLTFNWCHDFCCFIYRIKFCNYYTVRKTNIKAILMHCNQKIVNFKYELNVTMYTVMQRIWWAWPYFAYKLLGGNSNGYANSSESRLTCSSNGNVNAFAFQNHSVIINQRSRSQGQ